LLFETENPVAYHLITGAASGIGFLIAQTLLRRGDHVWAVDLDVQGLSKLQSFASRADQLHSGALDVRDADAWTKLIDEIEHTWPQLDTVMNVAGVLRPEYVGQTATANIHLQIDVNTKGLIFGTEAAARLMVPRRHGHIINIASIAGISPVPGCAIYCASKFAARGYSLSVAQELRAHGVKVTAICPDAVATPMLGPDNLRPEAAMIFSGAGPMPPEKVVRAVMRAIDKAPLEIILPGWRAMLAKTASLAPGLTSSVFGLMIWLGQRRLARTTDRRPH